MRDLVTVFKVTQDDWHPSWQLGSKLCAVEVMLDPPLTDHGSWRIAVFGADDYGMEFVTSNETKARNKYLEVIAMQYVNQDALKKLGFEVT